MGKKTYFLSLIILFSFVLATSSFAQKPILYGVSNGLPSTQITDISIDSNNFLWVSTRSGLSCLDGNAFTNYIGDSETPYKLTTNHITHTFEDCQGNLWIGTNQGLFLFDHKTNRFIHHKIAKDLPIDTSISSLADIPGKPDRMLLGTDGYGLYVLNTTTFEPDTVLSQKYNDAYVESYITAIRNDNNGNQWILGTNWFTVINAEKIEVIEPEYGFSDEIRNSIIIQGNTLDEADNAIYLGTVKNGILRCDTKTLKIEQLDIPAFNKIEMYSLLSEGNNVLLVGTEGSGLWRLNTKTLEAERLHYAQCPIDLEHSKIHNIAKDRQGNIWLSVYQKGILEIPGIGRLFSCYPIKASSSSEHNLANVSSFTELSNGTRVFGLDGGGIVTEIHEGATKNYSIENTILETNAVMGVCATPGDNTYIGTFNHGLYVLDRYGNLTRDSHLAQLDHESIMCLSYMKKSNILYIGTNGKGVYKYDLNNRELSCLIENPGTRWIVSLNHDSKNNLWIGTEGSLLKYDLDKDDYQKVEVTNSIRVFNLEEDAKGNVWFIADKGLFCCDNATGETKLIDLNNLPGEVFATMCMGNDGQVWVTSNHGIINYNPETEKSVRYNSADIQEIGSFSIRAAKRWTTGSLSFGGDNGMIIFKPEDIFSFNYRTSSVYFTRLWVNNIVTDYDPNLSASDNVLDKALWAATELRLNEESNSFSLSFDIQDFTTPIDIYYSYILEGYEHEWHIVRDEPTLRYSKLPTGEYTLKVCANHDNNHNEAPAIKELKIVIYQPWYETVWAIIIYAIILALFVVTATSLIVKLRSSAEILEAKENERIAKAKVAALSKEIEAAHKNGEDIDISGNYGGVNY